MTGDDLDDRYDLYDINDPLPYLRRHYVTEEQERLLRDIRDEDRFVIGAVQNSLALPDISKDERAKPTVAARQIEQALKALNRLSFDTRENILRHLRYPGLFGTYGGGTLDRNHRARPRRLVRRLPMVSAIPALGPRKYGSRRPRMIRTHLDKIRWLAAINNDPAVPPQVMAVAVALVDRLSLRTGRCNPSYETLGRDCATSRYSAKRHIRSLREAGWISVSTTTGGRFETNSFKLLETRMVDGSTGAGLNRFKLSPKPVQIVS